MRNECVVIHIKRSAFNTKQFIVSISVRTIPSKGSIIVYWPLWIQSLYVLFMQQLMWSSAAPLICTCVTIKGVQLMYVNVRTLHKYSIIFTADVNLGFRLYVVLIILLLFCKTSLPSCFTLTLIYNIFLVFPFCKRKLIGLIHEMNILIATFNLGF